MAPQKPPTPPTFALESTGPGPAATVTLRGALTLADAGGLWSALSTELERHARGSRVTLDVSRVESIDGGSMALLVYVRDELATRGIKAEFAGANERVQTLVHLYKGDTKPAKHVRRRAEGLFASIGRATLEVGAELKNVLNFLGMSTLAALGLLREPKHGNWRETLPIAERAGADAVPIVMLINFLVGFVMAYQGSNQLKQFGANIYVADLVGLSVTRELGPLMTAIILAGRSGAAFAAELGSMKVSEEVDALRTMGFGPIRYLVLPRTLALVLVAPILTLLADFVGVLGGMVVGVTSLGLTISGYISETQKSMMLWDVTSGVVKSLVFGFAVAMISCQQGFATTGGAEGVGRRTTASVVTSLFALIVIDAAFTIFFHAVNL